MASVLGRITTSDDSPRGPDVKHKVRVVHRWLERGETIEVELPRNLACAVCDGGGCDACGGSGAVSTRGRTDPAEFVQLTLPTVSRPSASPRPLALRIPERGGPARNGPLPRGMLILTVLSADTADPTVRKVRPSLTPPPALVEPASSVAVTRPERATPRGRLHRSVVLGVTFLVWLLLMVVLRAQGCL
ncbi:MAG: hypothetical protein JW751_13300 [Polyangiaceae bacterium]|nr:hypothetical protein [Polyangiaceae bacterium]